MVSIQNFITYLLLEISYTFQSQLVYFYNKIKDNEITDLQYYSIPLTIGSAMSNIR